MRLGLTFLVFFSGIGGFGLSQDKGLDLNRLLDLAATAQNQEARHLLTKVIQSLEVDKRAGSQRELEAMLVRLARGIEKSAQTQKEVQAIFGNTPKTVARQVFYRRYREQWIFEQTVRLTVVFDCIKGREPKLLTVLVPQGEN